MLDSYHGLISCRNSVPVDTYGAKALAEKLIPFYSQGWNSKKIAEAAKISSIATVHKASQGQIVTRKEFVSGQWIQVIDHETLSKLINFLEVAK